MDARETKLESWNTSAEAVASGATHVITAGAVQSNHCRATAIAAASLGLECELILRGSEPTL